MAEISGASGGSTISSAASPRFCERGASFPRTLRPLLRGLAAAPALRRAGLRDAIAPVYLLRFRRQSWDSFQIGEVLDPVFHVGAQAEVGPRELAPAQFNASDLARDGLG